MGIDIPQTREAPHDVVRRLHELDPTATVIYLGFNTWYVGKMRPTDESVRTGLTMLRNYWAMPVKHRGTPRSVKRYRYALAVMQGFRPVAQYNLRDLDGRVVRDFQLSQYHWQHAHGDLLETQWREEDEAREKHRDLFRDEYAAKDVLDYGRTSNFGRATPSVQSSITPVASSTRTRHIIPA